MKQNGHKYTLVHSFGYARHSWEVVCALGGVHFHISISDDADSKYEPTAGLEYHHSLLYQARAKIFDSPPDHIDCKITGGACWHDGTSLYATESLWPTIKSYLETGDHKRIFEILDGEAALHFEQPPSVSGPNDSATVNSNPK